MLEPPFLVTAGSFSSWAGGPLPFLSRPLDVRVDGSPWRGWGLRFCSKRQTDGAPGPRPAWLSGSRSSVWALQVSVASPGSHWKPGVHPAPSERLDSSLDAQISAQPLRPLLLAAGFLEPALPLSTGLWTLPPAPAPSSANFWKPQAPASSPSSAVAFFPGSVPHEDGCPREKPGTERSLPCVRPSLPRGGSSAAASAAPRASNGCFCLRAGSELFPGRVGQSYRTRQAGIFFVELQREKHP